LDRPSYGYRCEIVLRRFGCGWSVWYVDATLLEKNSDGARRFARNAIVKKVRAGDLANKIAMNDEAKTLCVRALGLNMEDEDEFHRFVQAMEKVADLLDLKERKSEG